MRNNIVLFILILLSVKQFKLKSQDTLEFLYKNAHSNLCDSSGLRSIREIMVLKDTANGQIVSGSNLIKYIFWERNYIKISDSMILYKTLYGWDTLLKTSMQQGEYFFFNDEATKYPPKPRNKEYTFRYIPIGIKFVRFDEMTKVHEFEVLSFYGQDKLLLGFDSKSGIVYLKIVYNDILCPDQMIIRK